MMLLTNHRIFDNSVAKAVWVADSGRPRHSMWPDDGACVYRAAGWTKRTIRCSFAFGSDCCSWYWGNLGSVLFVVLMLFLLLLLFVSVLCWLAMLRCLSTDPCPNYVSHLNVFEIYLVIFYVCVYAFMFLLSAIAKKKHSKNKQFRAFSLLKRIVINNLILEQTCLSIKGIAGFDSIRYQTITKRGNTIRNQFMPH